MKLHKQLFIAIFMSMVFVCTCIENADASHGSRTKEFVVEVAFHHLGDGTGFSTYVVPDAEGLYWETTVWLKRKFLRRSKTAYLEFFLFDNEINVVLINGKPYALPDTNSVHGIHLPFAGKTIIPIPLAQLRRGANTIAFRSNTLLPSGGPDDFEFGEVVLVLRR